MQGMSSRKRLRDEVHKGEQPAAKRPGRDARHKMGDCGVANADRMCLLGAAPNAHRFCETLRELHLGLPHSFMVQLVWALLMGNDTAEQCCRVDVARLVRDEFARRTTKVCRLVALPRRQPALHVTAQLQRAREEFRDRRLEVVVVASAVV